MTTLPEILTHPAVVTLAGASVTAALTVIAAAAHGRRA